jgi:hypothetical protein
VLSYAYWRAIFTTMRVWWGGCCGINKHPFTIIEAPPGVSGYRAVLCAGALIPMVEQPTVQGYNALQYRGNHSEFVVGRLKPADGGAGDGGPECSRGMAVQNLSGR